MRPELTGEARGSLSRYPVRMKRTTVLITGASQGLGAELARVYAARDANLILTARGERALDVLRSELRSRTEVLALSGDVCDDEHIHDLVRVANEKFGGIDTLINNASTLGASPMPELSLLGTATFNRIMDVNVRAPLHLIQHVLPGMRERGAGTIVNISSDAAVQAYAGWGGYSASKAALEHFSRILAEELYGSSIRVVVIDPGNMNTQMHRDAEPGVDLNGLASARDVAPMVVEAIGNAASGFSREEVQRVVARV